MERSITPKSVKQAEPRIVRSTRRLLHEVYWIRVEQVALKRLTGKDSIGLDFFRVAYTALMGDRLIRLVRVFEDNPQVASFWYVERCLHQNLERLLSATDVR